MDSKVYVVVVTTDSHDRYVYCFDYEVDHDDICYRVWVQEGSADYGEDDVNLQWYKDTCMVDGYWCSIEREGCLV